LALELALGLPRLAALALGGFLVIAVTLDIPRESFTLAKALEALECLLN